MGYMIVSKIGIEIAYKKITIKERLFFLRSNDINKFCCRLLFHLHDRNR